MENYVQYHKTEVYGPVEQGGPVQSETPERFWIATNKRRPDVIGQRIWLFSGQGRPRRYFLEAVFVAERFFLADDPDFYYYIEGSQGTRFRPALEVSGQPWFPDLLRAQGNFAFGLNVLPPRFLPHLEALTGRYSGK